MGDWNTLTKDQNTFKRIKIPSNKVNKLNKSIKIRICTLKHFSILSPRLSTGYWGNCQDSQGVFIILVVTQENKLPMEKKTLLRTSNLWGVWKKWENKMLQNTGLGPLYHTRSREQWGIGSCCVMCCGVLDGLAGCPCCKVMCNWCCMPQSMQCLWWWSTTMQIYKSFAGIQSMAVCVAMWRGVMPRDSEHVVSLWWWSTTVKTYKSFTQHSICGCLCGDVMRSDATWLKYKGKIQIRHSVYVQVTSQCFCYFLSKETKWSHCTVIFSH